jgi:hypothetical protein
VFGYARGVVKEAELKEEENKNNFKTEIDSFISVNKNN